MLWVELFNIYICVFVCKYSEGFDSSSRLEISPSLSLSLSEELSSKLFSSLWLSYDRIFMPLRPVSLSVVKITSNLINITKIHNNSPVPLYFNPNWAKCSMAIKLSCISSHVDSTSWIILMTLHENFVSSNIVTFSSICYVEVYFSLNAMASGRDFKKSLHQGIRRIAFVSCRNKWSEYLPFTASSPLMCSR